MNLPGAAAAGLRKAFRATIATNSMVWVTFRWKTSLRQLIFFVYATKYSPTTRPLGTWFWAIPSRFGLPLTQLMKRPSPKFYSTFGPRIFEDVSLGQGCVKNV